MSNFNETLSTNEEFLDEIYCRELMIDDLAWSTSNMDDRTLREAIVADLVSFCMWEKEKKTQLNITFEELTRFVDSSAVDRIRQQLEHEEIKHLFVCVDGKYRMRDQKEILQAAQDYSGIWYDGFEPSDTTVIVMTNYKPLKEAVERHGGIENLAKAMAMELAANVLVSPSSIYKLN